MDVLCPGKPATRLGFFEVNDALPAAIATSWPVGPIGAASTKSLAEVVLGPARVPLQLQRTGSVGRLAQPHATLLRGDCIGGGLAHAVVRVDRTADPGIRETEVFVRGSADAHSTLWVKYGPKGSVATGAWVSEDHLFQFVESGTGKLLGEYRLASGACGTRQFQL